jgi:Ser/Thr protein kinase RdoA (MazF antagonist)
LKKEEHLFDDVLKAYGLKSNELSINPFGTGLINLTWKVTGVNNEFILQNLNGAVFKQPLNIAENISLISQYLKQHFPNYNFVAPLATLNGKEFVKKNGQGYFRLFPFVPGSHSKDIVSTPQQAYEAAVQFGRFSRVLSGFDANLLKTTLPSFHNLSLRYRQFIIALNNGDKKRIAEAHQFTKMVASYFDIVTEYERIQSDPQFKKRVTHHDTKISNVLFDNDDKAICVIDLDTVMPGYFISDVGDMMRTYLSPVNEDETDFSKIEVRDDFYHAIVNGYYSEMKTKLTETEKRYFFYAGKFMIYMQAIRFLTDYLNNDIYYGANHDRQNYLRAKNQIVLLQKLIEKEDVFFKKSI